MKPDQAYAGSIDDNLDSVDEIDFDLDDSPEGRRHIISMLTDLYTDFELACVREYATNARDANIEAGNAHLPIEVTLPNSLSPWYSVKDSGPGLDREGLRNVFAKYGASTKRDSNAYNGAFGVGGKAALTYTAQFTLVSVKDGIKTNAVVNRREDGVGVMKVVSETPTDEPNGTEVRIPVKDRNSFAEKCREFFYFWQPGTVLVDGRQPRLLTERTDLAKVGDNAYLLSNSSYGDRDVIVMGNVGYKLPDRQLAETITSNWGATVVYFVEIGEVSLAPSREALGFSPKTQARLDLIKQELTAQIEGQIQSDLDGIDSYVEAFEVWTRWKRVMGKDKLPKMTYKGETFVDNMRAPHWSVEIGGGKYRPSTNDYGNSRREHTYVDLSTLLSDNILVVEGYTGSGPTPTQMLKIEQHLSDTGQTFNSVLLFDTIPGAPWTDDVETLQWAVIDAVKVKRNTTAGGVRGTIPVVIYRSGGYKNQWRNDGQKGKWDSITQLDPNEKVLYVSPAEILDYIEKIKQVFSVFPNYQIVALGKNRWEKFLRENPEAMEFYTYWARHWENDLVATMTKDEIFYADHDTAYRELAKQVKDGTNDKTLTKLAGIKVDQAKIDLYNGRVSATKNASDHYPLITNQYGHPNLAHAILYINAVIAEGK